MNNPQIIIKNAPFKHFCMSVGAIPTSYKDSLDYYETLLYLIKYLEETVIPVVNNNGLAVSELQSLYVELKNYVDNYFTDLNVQNEINNKLDEMVESGEFDEILSNYFNTKEDIISNKNLITLNRIRRFFVNNGKYQTGLSGAYYGYMQGATNTKNGKYIIAYMPSNDDYLYTNNINLVEYNSDGSVNRSKILELGHANSLAFNLHEELVYVVSGSKYVSEESVPDYRLYTLDYETLSVQETNVFEEQITGVSYDNIKNKLYVGYAKDKIYELHSNYNIKTTINLDYPSFVENAGVQSFLVHDGLIYTILIKPDVIITYNLDGSLNKVYSVPKFANGGTMYVGELEDLGILNDKLVLFTNSLTTYYSQDTQVNLFVMDLVHNTLDNPIYMAERGFLSNNINTVYVDNASVSLNPDGSSTNPFKEIFEAINYLNGTRYKGAGRIYVKGGTYKNIFFFNNNIEIIHNGGSAINIGGLLAVASKVSIGEATYNNTNTGLNRPIECENSEITLVNATINNIVDYGIYLVKSKLNYRGNEIVSSTTNDTYTIYADASSIINIGQGTGGYNDIYLDSPSAFLNPNRVVIASNIKIYYDDITLNKMAYATSLFKYITFVVNINGIYRTFKFRSAQSKFKMDLTQIDENNNPMYNSLTVEVADNEFSVTNNIWGHTESDEFLVSSKTNNTDNNNFMSIVAIELTNIC